jgi:DNA sulfur modification protein DndD
MIWKDSQFTSIKLTSDYKLEVFDRYGLPARWDLSAGERELLSLSFIAAMAKASGGEAPFIIDTPFGRISEKPRKNISMHLPEMTRQLAIFVTDVELTPESEKNFKERTEKEYTLLFNDFTGTTKIMEGKHV